MRPLSFACAVVTLLSLPERRGCDTSGSETLLPPRLAIRPRGNETRSRRPTRPFGMCSWPAMVHIEDVRPGHGGVRIGLGLDPAFAVAVVIQTLAWSVLIAGRLCVADSSALLLDICTGLYRGPGRQ